MMSGDISFPICTSPLFSPRPFIHPFQLNCPRKGFFISLLRWADELKPVIEVSAFSSITGYFFCYFTDTNRIASWNIFVSAIVFLLDFGIRSSFAIIYENASSRIFGINSGSSG